MKTGLFFGAFNPIHNGHMLLANYMLSFTDLDSLWFIVSPHNPLKEKSSLLANNHRLELVKLAIGINNKMKASNIEFKLTQPSYTVNTLAHLQEKFPKNVFSLIMGSDNLQSFHKWKNYEHILEHYQLYVYPRPGYDGGALRNHKNIKLINAPLVEITSSFIRDAIKNKKEVRYFMPESVYEYLSEMNFYKK